MSWVRSKVYRTMEMRNKNRTQHSRIRSIADMVALNVGHVVSFGAHLLQNHIINEHMENIMDAIKRLEEISSLCRGEERIILLRRWLVSLEQIDGTRRGCASSDTNLKFDKNYEQFDNEDSKFVSCYSLDYAQEAQMNIFDVFLHSHVVEGIVLSMIMEEPNDEEISLISEIFRLSLMGEKQVQDAIINGIQVLAKAFSSYQEEVLVKREELLHYAEFVITRLKVNAEIARIDMKVSTLQRRLNKSETCSVENGNDYENDILINQDNLMTTEALKDVTSKVQTCLKLKSLLCEKKTIHYGDSQESHSQKVNKLNVLIESLTKYILKDEKCILDHRSQKDEALHFRLVKATEVSRIEKELVAEIETLDHQKDELEVALRKVKSSLIAAKTRLRNVREEKYQFDEASDEILEHLQSKEEELSYSISSCKVEAQVVYTTIRFLEDTWNIQLALTKLIKKEIIDELEVHSKGYTELFFHHLNTYKVEIENLVSRFRILIRQLKSNEEHNTTSQLEDEGLPVTIARSTLEQEYMDLEFKLTTAFGMVEGMRQTYLQRENFLRNNEENIEELFNNLETLKVQFQSLDRPSLQSRTQKKLIWQGKPLKLKPKNDSKKTELNGKESNNRMLPTVNLLELEGTPETSSARRGKGHTDIIDWEFDALEY